MPCRSLQNDNWDCNERRPLIARHQLSNLRMRFARAVLDAAA
jgi:hypothetical protein